MSPPPCSTSPSTMSSTSDADTPARFSDSATAYFARSNALTSSNVPLRAVPIAVRQAETMTASPMMGFPFDAWMTRASYDSPGTPRKSGSDGLQPPFRVFPDHQNRHSLGGVTGEAVVIDELFDAAGAAAMVDLCGRFGAYRMYAEHEQLDT